MATNQNSLMQNKALVTKYANEIGLDPELAWNVALHESGGKHYTDDGSVIKSPTGPRGIFQLSQSAAKDQGISDRDDLEQNIKAGVGYLKAQIDGAGGNVAAGLGRYNQGAGAWNKQQQSGKYEPEVVNYINDPKFAKWVGENRIQNIANPMKGKQAKVDNTFTPDQLTRGALKNQINPDEATAQNAAMNTSDVTQQTPSNSLLQTQTSYENAKEAERLQALQDADLKKKKAYSDMAYMAMGAILGKKQERGGSASGIGIDKGAGSPQALQGYGNKALANFQLFNSGGR
ncbi:transglycosylase SLT domain-containing protein [Enterobacter pseudoroggenkampii]|uniref:transglycosylase SLT domain-containing protein n=1 Tax=Enterobacter pseudoroggenkampii TaxID=2996112 RepID=UPI002263E09E|nr:transglycosylase SLT domain-containing protein [Enterobacter pseudoroggenkampii]MCX8289113.1 transglycosylase SLT domain-containing protein [Enterobacter pseudoroggenkampii]